MKAKSINSVQEFQHWFFKDEEKSKLSHDKRLAEEDVAVERLIDIYGMKIVRGCAPNEELTAEESAARSLYHIVKDELKSIGGEDYKNSQDVYEGKIVETYHKSREKEKYIVVGVLIVGIFFIIATLALLKYLLF